MAHNRWHLPIKCALVAGFINRIASEKAKALHIPYILTETVHVPTRHTAFYRRLQDQLAYNVTITDKPTYNLMAKFIEYIESHQ